MRSVRPLSNLVFLFLALIGFALPTAAAKRVTVEQLAQIVIAGRTQPDASFAQKLSELELTERLSQETLSHWQIGSPGPISATAWSPQKDAASRDRSDTADDAAVVARLQIMQTSPATIEAIKEAQTNNANFAHGARASMTFEALNYLAAISLACPAARISSGFRAPSLSSYSPPSRSGREWSTQRCRGSSIV